MLYITPVLQSLDKNLFLFNALFPQSLLIIRLEIMVDLGSLRGFMTMEDSRSFRVLLAQLGFGVISRRRGLVRVT